MPMPKANKPRSANPSDIQMPHDLFSESGIIGTILYYADAKIFHSVSHLTPEMFYLDNNRLLWRAISACVGEGMPPDSLSVYDQINRIENDSEKIKHFPSLMAEYSRTHASPSKNISNAAVTVRDLFIRRKTIVQCQKAISMAYSQLPVSDIQEALSIDIHEKPKDVWMDMGKVADQTLFEIEARRQRGNTLGGIPTGINELDDLFDGLKPGQLIILAARPSVGKTALAVTFGLAAARSEKSVGFVSLEMNGVDMFKRAISSACKIPLNAVNNMDTSAIDWTNLSKDGIFFPMYFSDSIYDIGEIDSAIRNLCENTGCGIIFVDYLQLIETSKTNRNDNREREIAQMSRRLKQAAMQLRIPIVALSQLNRGAADREPRMSDLRESGALEQDADIVILLDRPAMRGVMQTEKSIGEKIDLTRQMIINVAKHRNGALGKFEYTYRPDINQLEEWNDGDNIQRQSAEWYSPRN